MKAVAAALMAAVLCLILARQGKDLALMLTVLVSVMILAVAAGYLGTVLDFLADLEALVGLQGDHFRILMKVVGIGIVSEMASTVCADAGNAAIGKALQVLATILIVCLALPLLQQLLELIRQILEGL